MLFSLLAKTVNLCSTKEKPHPGDHLETDKYDYWFTDPHLAAVIGTIYWLLCHYYPLTLSRFSTLLIGIICWPLRHYCVLTLLGISFSWFPLPSIVQKSHKVQQGTSKSTHRKVRSHYLHTCSGLSDKLLKQKCQHESQAASICRMSSQQCSIYFS